LHHFFADLIAITASDHRGRSVSRPKTRNAGHARVLFGYGFGLSLDDVRSDFNDEFPGAVFGLHNSSVTGLYGKSKGGSKSLLNLRDHAFPDATPAKGKASSGFRKRSIAQKIGRWQSRTNWGRDTTLGLLQVGRKALETSEDDKRLWLHRNDCYSFGMK